MLKILLSFFLLTLILNISCGKEKDNTNSDSDLRVYQHGLDCIKLPNKDYAVIWASSGNPPQGADVEDNWTHDIYYNIVNQENPFLDDVITIISFPGAQEPASSDISRDGKIMITMEDAWNTNNEVAQRYGIYDSNFQNIKPYPNMVFDGGHSGHVAAVNDKFVVFYSEGWVNDGGVDNLGSGDNVMLKTYSSVGEELNTLDISVGEASRDWWPLVAGSENKACLVWQRYIENQTFSNLMLSIYNPNTNESSDNLVLENNVKYYTYDVQFIEAIARFLIAGTYQNQTGFAYLIDESGNITASVTNLPTGIVRQAKAIVSELSNNEVKIVYAASPNGLIILKAGKNKIEYLENKSDTYNWSYMGTDGFFINDTTVYILTLSKQDIQQKRFVIN